MIDDLKALLKANGFKKKAATWHKDLGEVIAVLNLQSSQWDKETSFVNIGVYLKGVEERNDPPINQCHVQRRVDHLDEKTTQIVAFAMEWFEQRSTVSQVKEKAKSDSKSGLVMYPKIEKLK